MVLTVEHATAFDARLRDIENKTFRTTREWRKTLAKFLEQHEYEYVRTRLDAQGTDIENRKDVQAFLIALRSEIASLPSIVIRLAFRPQYVFAEEILAWLSRSGSGKGRVKFVYDPNIVAGIILEYGGVIYDRSAASRIDEGLSAVS